MGGDEARPAELRGAGLAQDVLREREGAVHALPLPVGEGCLERLVAVLVEAHDAVVVVVHHHEQPDPPAVRPEGLDERCAPERAVLVLDRGREADRVHDRRRLDHEAAVLVVLVRHRVGADRVDHVRVLRLVEEPEDEASRVEAEIPADVPTAGARRQAGAEEELWRVQRPGGDDDRSGVDAPELAVAIHVLDPSRLAVLDHDALHPSVGAEVEPPGRQGVGDVGVHRRLARVRGTALEARPAPRAVRVRVRAHGLKPGAEAAEGGLDGAHALAPVAALANAEPLLDPVVVRLEVDVEAARLLPFRVVLLVRAKRDLRVDRGGAADAATGDQTDCAAGAAVDEREADRPPEVVGRLRLPASEVGCGLVGPELEQRHAAAALRELARHDAAARARAHHDDVEHVSHPIPR